MRIKKLKGFRGIVGHNNNQLAPINQVVAQPLHIEFVADVERLVIGLTVNFTAEGIQVGGDVVTTRFVDKQILFQEFNIGPRIIFFEQNIQKQSQGYRPLLAVNDVVHR